MTGEHVFIDETKLGGLTVAAARLRPERLQGARSVMRSLLLRGQSHLHFTKEKDARRGEIIRALRGLDVRIDIYEAAATDARKAREACLQQVIAHMVNDRCARLVIEKDDSLLRFDQVTLFRAVRQAGAEDGLTYEHLPKRADPLLWIADAAAWCWTHQHWRERISPLVGSVYRVG